MNLLLIDDHALFREGFTLLLERTLPKPLRIVETNTAESGLAAARREFFDLIFLDLGLPGINGMEGLLAFRQACPATALVILSGNEDPETIRLTLAQGAQGYISKAMTTTAIVDALDRILDGQMYAPNQLPANSTDAPILTGRQMEVLTQLCAGRSNREIAQQLGVSENTVRAHATSIFRQLGVRSRTEAVLLAKRKGWC